MKLQFPINPTASRPGLCKALLCFINKLPESTNCFSVKCFKSKSHINMSLFGKLTDNGCITWLLITTSHSLLSSSNKNKTKLPRNTHWLAQTTAKGHELPGDAPRGLCESLLLSKQGTDNDSYRLLGGAYLVLVLINEVNLHRARLVYWDGWPYPGWTSAEGGLTRTLLALCDFDMRRLRRTLTYFLTLFRYVTKPPRSTQPSTLRGTIKRVPAKRRWCWGWGVKEGMIYLRVKLCVAIPEPFRKCIGI